MFLFDGNNILKQIVSCSIITFYAAVFCQELELKSLCSAFSWVYLKSAHGNTQESVILQILNLIYFWVLWCSVYIAPPSSYSLMVIHTGLPVRRLWFKLLSKLFWLWYYSTARTS